MAGPDPAVAAVRTALRRALADLDGGTVVAGVSGGADSLALAAGLAFVAPRSGVSARVVVVDHRLQDGSGDVAERAAACVRTLGLPAQVVAVDVDPARPGGPEAAARRARRDALTAAADAHGARAVLLAHTRDDQAETVLLGLARGAGPRSLAGMAAVDGRWRRPLLDLTREQTEAACRAQDLPWWDDPHNTDPAYARVRVRRDALPALESALGPGVRDALARTAALARSDADLLDAQADEAYARVRDGDGSGLDVTALGVVPDALRGRVLRRWALESGCPGSDLTLDHVRAVDALVVDWRGQVGIDLPGGLRAVRADGWLRALRPVAG